MMCFNILGSGSCKSTRSYIIRPGKSRSSSVSFNSTFSNISKGLIFPSGTPHILQKPIRFHLSHNEPFSFPSALHQGTPKEFFKLSFSPNSSTLTLLPFFNALSSALLLHLAVYRHGFLSFLSPNHVSVSGHVFPYSSSVKTQMIRQVVVATRWRELKSKSARQMRMMQTAKRLSIRSLRGMRTPFGASLCTWVRWIIPMLFCLLATFRYRSLRD